MRHVDVRVKGIPGKKELNDKICGVGCTWRVLEAARPVAIEWTRQGKSGMR